MASWYHVRYGNEIKPVEVVRETPHQVVVSESGFEYRHHKAGEYFPSFEEAKDHLVKRLEMQISNLQSSMDRAKANLGKIKNLTEEACRKV